MRDTAHPTAFPPPTARSTHLSSAGPARPGTRLRDRPLQAAAALCTALAAVLAAPAAQAGDGRVQWSVQIGVPVPVPLPLPLPVRVETRPVYVQGPAYPAPAYPPPAWRDRDRDGVPDWRDGYDNRRPPYPHHHHHHPGWRVDRDRDGVPDWRDGYDNRRDWRPVAPGWQHRGPDRDHDGRPDWRERPGR